MCTLAAYVRVSAEIPLLVAANRDEFLDRPSAEPAVIAYRPAVFAGQDLSAGGTWFGVNEHGMVVGLLNRRQAAGLDPTRRSRGLLCLEILQTRSPTRRATRLRAVAGGRLQRLQPAGRRRARGVRRHKPHRARVHAALAPAARRPSAHQPGAQ